jgi:hypothetical protein
VTLTPSMLAKLDAMADAYEAYRRAGPPLLGPWNLFVAAAEDAADGWHAERADERKEVTDA